MFKSVSSNTFNDNQLVQFHFFFLSPKLYQIILYFWRQERAEPTSPQ